MARIVRIHEYGDADVLKIEDINVAPPAEDEVQIAVRSIGLNRAEVMFRNNAYLQQAQFPSRLGYEAAGVVEAVGSAVTDFVKGDTVSVIPALDIARWGTYGEVTNMPTRLVVKHPETLSFEEAAASWMQYVTAWGALIEQAKLSQGEFVIVTAASSSVGLAALQIARQVGATVIATTRTGAKRQALLDAGAHHVIATEEEDLAARVMNITAGAGARVVFDPVGGPSFEAVTASMARGGILLEYGALSAEPTPFPLFTVLGKSLTLKGYLYSEIVSDEAALARAKEFIVAGLASGSLKPVIARVFPFNEIREATRFLESNEQIGKIVVNI
ncbi:NADPH:quinone reductase [Agrobacterium tumefaciens]|uniref:zinc-dependent alcohol dehydrogenase family protein n=1 Tax=Agrobacterium tumefaciens TaxID=358 RepID=UPI0012B9184A|nr:zinc-dependent alcohol dehydrogenase family protein [Agrobacterium tumefaciens]MQB07291.1 NADPH:quinone reductase [Agrobacterium tumefaciens]